MNRVLAKDRHKTRNEFISVSENYYRHQYARFTRLFLSPITFLNVLSYNKNEGSKVESSVFIID